MHFFRIVGQSFALVSRERPTHAVQRRQTLITIHLFAVQASPLGAVAAAFFTLLHHVEVLMVSFEGHMYLVANQICLTSLFKYGLDARLDLVTLSFQSMRMLVVHVAKARITGESSLAF